MSRGSVVVNLPDQLAERHPGAQIREMLGLARSFPLDRFTASGPQLTEQFRERRAEAIQAFAPLLRARRAHSALRRLELACDRDESVLEVFQTPTAGLVVVANVVHNVSRELDGGQVIRIRHLHWKLVDVLTEPTSLEGAPSRLPASCRCIPQRTLTMDRVREELERAGRTGKRRAVLR